MIQSKIPSWASDEVVEIAANIGYCMRRVEADDVLYPLIEEGKVRLDYKASVVEIESGILIAEIKEYWSNADK